MKKIVFLLLTLLCLSSCGKKENHQHEFVETIEKEATCTSDGTKSFTCIKGDYVYYETIPKTGHNYVKTIVKQATCTTKGQYKYTCKRCNHTYYQDIKALGHDLVYYSAKEPTCNQNGYYAYQKCVRSGCNYSTYRKIDAYGHNYTNRTIIKEATCFEEGEARYTCSRCGKTNTEKISKKSHNWSYQGDGGYCSNCNSNYYTEGLTFGGYSHYVGNTLTKSGYNINSYSGSSKIVYIPSLYKGKPVYNISNNAFKGKSINAVYLGDNVETIETYAFYGCYSLNSVDLKQVKKIYNCAFMESGITSITIPSTVESIGTYAFLNTSLSSATFKYLYRTLTDSSNTMKVSLNVSSSSAATFLKNTYAKYTWSKN